MRDGEIVFLQSEGPSGMFAGELQIRYEPLKWGVISDDLELQTK